MDLTYTQDDVDVLSAALQEYLEPFAIRWVSLCRHWLATMSPLSKSEAVSQFLRKREPSWEESPMDPVEMIGFLANYRSGDGNIPNYRHWRDFVMPLQDDFMHVECDNLMRSIRSSQAFSVSVLVNLIQDMRGYNKEQIPLHEAIYKRIDPFSYYSQIDKNRASMNNFLHQLLDYIEMAQPLSHGDAVPTEQKISFETTSGGTLVVPKGCILKSFGEYYGLAIGKIKYFSDSEVPAFREKADRIYNRMPYRHIPTPIPPILGQEVAFFDDRRERSEYFKVFRWSMEDLCEHTMDQSLPSIVDLFESILYSGNLGELIGL